MMGTWRGWGVYMELKDRELWKKSGFFDWGWSELGGIQGDENYFEMVPLIPSRVWVGWLWIRSDWVGFYFDRIVFELKCYLVDKKWVGWWLGESWVN